MGTLRAGIMLASPSKNNKYNPSSNNQQHILTHNNHEQTIREQTIREQSIREETFVQ